MVLDNFHTEDFCVVYETEVFEDLLAHCTGPINLCMVMFCLNQLYQHQVQHILCTQVQAKVMSLMLLHMLVENHHILGGDQVAYMVVGLKNQHLTSHLQQPVHVQWYFVMMLILFDSICDFSYYLKGCFVSKASKAERWKIEIASCHGRSHNWLQQSPAENTNLTIGQPHLSFVVPTCLSLSVDTGEPAGAELADQQICFFNFKLSNRWLFCDNPHAC